MCLLLSRRHPQNAVYILLDILPFGCLRAILPLLEGDLKKLFKTPKKVDFGGKVPLYGYQEEAVGAMLINHYGILQSPAGSGKTQMGIALACDLGVKTLWLTHTMLFLCKEGTEEISILCPVDERLPLSDTHPAAMDFF